MNKNNNSKIFEFAFCANDRYLCGLLMAILTVLRSSRDEVFIRINVIDGGLSDESLQILKESVKVFSKCILCVHSCDVELFRKIAEGGKRHISMFFRLDLPRILECDKVIYIDSDVLVLRDITHFFDCVGHPKEPIAAVQDWETPSLSADSYEMARLCGLENVTSYFNSGVLVLDLDRLRQDCFTEHAVEVLAKVGHMSKFHDQTAFNIIYSEQWADLGATWNTPSWHFDKSFDNRLPGIVHYTNSAPWLERRYTPSQALFERIAGDLGVELPRPETSMTSSCTGAFLVWLLAPLRIGYNLLRAAMSNALGKREKADASQSIASHWLEYFVGAPIRVLRYRKRIREINSPLFDPFVRKVNTSNLSI